MIFDWLFIKRPKTKTINSNVYGLAHYFTRWINQRTMSYQAQQISEIVMPPADKRELFNQINFFHIEQSHSIKMRLCCLKQNLEDT